MKRLWMGLLIALLLCVGVAALAEDTPAAPAISLAELTAGKDGPFSLARGDEEARWACAKLYAVAGEEETLVLDKTEALTGETITARFLDLPETGGQEELYVSLLCRESGSDASWETVRETDWRPGMEAPSVTPGLLWLRHRRQRVPRDAQL